MPYPNADNSRAAGACPATWRRGSRPTSSGVSGPDSSWLVTVHHRTARAASVRSPHGKQQVVEVPPRTACAIGQFGVVCLGVLFEEKGFDCPAGHGFDGGAADGPAVQQRADGLFWRASRVRVEPAVAVAPALVVLVADRWHHP